MKIELSEAADGDLRAIYKYSYRRFGEEQADRYYKNLWACFHRLAENPRLGRRRADIHPPVHSHQHDRHVIFYDVHDDRILIVRVLHERMDIDRHLRT